MRASRAASTSRVIPVSAATIAARAVSSHAIPANAVMTMPGVARVVAQAHMAAVAVAYTRVLVAVVARVAAARAASASAR